MGRFGNVVLILGVVLLPFATPAGATSFFDVFADLPIVGPPYSSHGQGIGHMNGGVFVPDLVHHTFVQQIAAGGPGGNPLPCQLNGLPPGTPVIDSFFDITYRIDLGGGQPWPVDSFFDIFYEVEIPGVGRAPLVPLHAGDPTSFFDINYNSSFFDITYRCEVGPGGGCHELHLHGEFQPGLNIMNLGINHQPMAASFFDVFFDIELTPGMLVDPNLPILKTTTNGQYLTGPLATQAVTWGKVKSLYQQ